MKLENITIEQFMKFQLLTETFGDNPNKLNAELIKVIYGNLDAPKKETDNFILQVNKILLSEPDFIHRFEYQGIEYGFIPNLDEISTGEFIDLDDYIKDGKQLHKIASILYRPIVKQNGKYYDIEKYDGTKNADKLKGVDYKVAVGALVFFWNLGNSLLKATNIYTHNETKKMVKTKPNSN
jgi:hypothetical protein